MSIQQMSYVVLKVHLINCFGDMCLVVNQNLHKNIVETKYVLTDLHFLLHKNMQFGKSCVHRLLLVSISIRKMYPGYYTPACGANIYSPTCYHFGYTILYKRLV